MHILAVAATEAEIPRLTTGRHGTNHLDVLITGVGMVATAAHTARALTARRYDLPSTLACAGASTQQWLWDRCTRDGRPTLGVGRRRR